ncbi:hypothetical protein Tco_0188782 [Tanacetum coccineum]
MFPRIYNLETVKDCSIASRLNLQDLTSVLCRRLRGGVESVQFDGLKAAIGNITLSEHRDSWLPSRVNLDKRNIEVSSLLCPSCLDDLEKDVDIPVCGNILEWYDWLPNVHISPKAHLGLEGVGERYYGVFGTIVIKAKGLEAQEKDLR